MNDRTTRRDVLAAGTSLGILGASLLAPLDAGAKAATKTSGRKHALNLDDPQERFKALIKMRGSLEDGPVHTIVRLHIYGYGNDGNLVPFFSMNNYAVNVWKKLPNGNFAVKVYEVGTYTKFDDYEDMTEWTNPFTNEKLKVLQFRSGPLSVEFSPQGIVTGPEATLKPKQGAIEVIEDTVMTSTGSSFHFPTPFPADKYPNENAGPTYYWDSFYTHMSPLAVVADPGAASAPAEISLNNFVTWAPWFRMAQKPGRTYGRGAGRKISGPGALPAAVLKSIERFTPQVLDIPNWGPPYNDALEYRKELEAARGK
jgi:hypothetical protein